MSCEYCKYSYGVRHKNIGYTFVENKFCPMCGEHLVELKPLTLEELKKMDNKRVVVRLNEDYYLPVLVAYHTDACDDQDGDDVWLTDNLGGRSTYQQVIDMGGIVYDRPPSEEA